MLTRRWRSLRCRITGHRWSKWEFLELDAFWDWPRSECGRCHRVRFGSSIFRERSSRQFVFNEPLHDPYPGIMHPVRPRGTAAPEATPPASTPPLGLRYVRALGEGASSRSMPLEERSGYVSSTSASAMARGSSTFTLTYGTHSAFRSPEES